MKYIMPDLANCGIEGTSSLSLLSLDPDTHSNSQCHSNRSPLPLWASPRCSWEHLKRSTTTPRKGNAYQKDEKVSWYISVMDRKPGWKGRQREREEIFKCVEMRSKCPQTNGLPSPPPGHFRLMRREIEECGHYNSWAYICCCFCGRLDWGVQAEARRPV